MSKTDSNVVGGLKVFSFDETHPQLNEITESLSTYLEDSVTKNLVCSAFVDPTVKEKKLV